jgi:hypothetical protein
MFLRKLKSDDPHLPDPRRVASSVPGAISFTWEQGNSSLLVEVVSNTAPRLYHQWITASGREVGFEDRDVVIQRLYSLYQ